MMENTDKTVPLFYPPRDNIQVINKDMKEEKQYEKEKFILDACCGGRMFWFNKKHPNTIYADFRKREKGHCLHRENHSIEPDEIMDFRNMAWKDKSFKLVIFDPPHIFGKETGNMTKQYGWLNKETWKDDIKKGFDECWRVLEDGGILIFKWSESSVSKRDILALIKKQPLFGHQVGSKMKRENRIDKCIPNGNR